MTNQKYTGIFEGIDDRRPSETIQNGPDILGRTRSSPLGNQI